MAITTKKIPLPKYVIKDDAVTLSGVQGARLIDCYIDPMGNIRKRPGLDSHIDLGVQTKIDGLFWWDVKNVMLSVSGGNVYKTTSADGVTTKVSDTDKLNTGPIVSFTNDDTYTIMANKGKMLKYDNSSAPSFIADGDAPTTVDFVGYLNTRILAKRAGTPLVHYSDVSDATAWGAASAFQPESKPDNLVSMAVVGNEILLIGKETTETWYDTGNASAPFRVMKAATLADIGGIAANSFKNCAGSLIWLDNRRMFVRVDRRSPREISALIAKEISGITPISDAVGMFINYGDFAFYICNLPTAKKTYCYDLKADVFMEWGYWNLATATWDAFLCNTHAFSPLWDKHYLGSNVTGKIYTLNKDTFQDDGNPIRSLIQTSPNDYGLLKRKRCFEIRLKLKRGAGTISGNEPKFRMRFKDDGKDWTNYRTGSLGKMGESRYIVRFQVLGQYITRQWEFSHSENSDFVLAEVEEDFEVLE